MKEIAKKSKIDPLKEEEVKEGGKIELVEDLNIESIEFDDVWFRYPTKKDQWVFKGLNFKIKKGEKIAFVGESGSGKSTILGLLLRFYEP